MTVLQDWVTKLTFMQQTVLLCAIRGPDGFAKHHPCKPLLRWYRRCVVISAFDKVAITNPYQKGGGSFTGPSCKDSVLKPDWWEQQMKNVVDDFIGARDEYHLHFYMHFIHAAEIIGYKHSDKRIREFWNRVYVRMIESLHMLPETEEMMDKRLSDTEDGWLARSDTSETEKYKESKKDINEINNTLPNEEQWEKIKDKVFPNTSYEHNNFIMFLKQLDIDPNCDGFKIIGTHGYLRVFKWKRNNISTISYFKYTYNNILSFDISTLTKTERVDLINELHEEGCANDDIALFLNVSQSLISKYITNKT